MSNKELAEKLLEKYDGDWKAICKEEVLSEDFIREFKDEVDWWGISENQKL